MKIYHIMGLVAVVALLMTVFVLVPLPSIGEFIEGVGLALLCMGAIAFLVAFLNALVSS